MEQRRVAVETRSPPHSPPQTALVTAAAVSQSSSRIARFIDRDDAAGEFGGGEAGAFEEEGDARGWVAGEVMVGGGAS